MWLFGLIKTPFQKVALSIKDIFNENNINIQDSKDLTADELFILFKYVALNWHTKSAMWTDMFTYLDLFIVNNNKELTNKISTSMNNWVSTEELLTLNKDEFVATFKEVNLTLLEFIRIIIIEWASSKWIPADYMWALFNENEIRKTLWIH